MEITYCDCISSIFYSFIHSFDTFSRYILSASYILFDIKHKLAKSNEPFPKRPNTFSIFNRRLTFHLGQTSQIHNQRVLLCTYITYINQCDFIISVSKRKPSLRIWHSILLNSVHNKLKNNTQRILMFCCAAVKYNVSLYQCIGVHIPNNLNSVGFQN